MDVLFNFFNKQSSEKVKGCYLAITLDPNEFIKKLSRKIREEHGFLPMEMAVPPRAKDALHTTAAFFMSGITEEQIELLKKTFKDKIVSVTIDGHGRAEKDASQALYFSVEPGPILEIREKLTNLGFDFRATDPHITFGVHSETRKDVHGVPKQTQIQLDPFTVNGKINLKLGMTELF